MNLQSLTTLFAEKGCKRILCKILAPNDNSKNQIYLGGDFTAVSVLPCINIREHRVGEIARTKRTSKEIFKGDIDFSWVDEEGTISKAPNVQLILYPQILLSY